VTPQAWASGLVYAHPTHRACSCEPPFSRRMHSPLVHRVLLRQLVALGLELLRRRPHVGTLAVAHGHANERRPVHGRSQGCLIRRFGCVRIQRSATGAWRKAIGRQVPRSTCGRHRRQPIR
jgi:hypothetical protein